MRSTFACPIMALTATLKPSSLLEMKSTILREPVIIKGSVDRRNVMVNICPYRHSSEKKCSPTENVWSSVATHIQEIVEDKVTIVYCAYANECEDLTLNFLQLGLKSSSYTGKQTSSKDKKEIYESMKSGNIQILVATKAFGMGINLLDIRFIFHVVIPENLSLWIQEMGRAGRDGKPASAYLLINERQDMKKLTFWIKNSTKTEAEIRIEDYKQSLLYIANAFTGDCLRKFHLKYFDDVSVESPLPPDQCCIGCKIREEIPFQSSIDYVRSVLGSIQVLNDHGLEKIFEGKVIDWISGTSEDWMARYFNNSDLKQEPSFGCFHHLPRIQTELTVKGILLQCLSKRYLSLDFQTLPNSNIMTKCWVLTELGRQIGKDQLNHLICLNQTKWLNFSSSKFTYFVKNIFKT